MVDECRLFDAGFSSYLNFSLQMSLARSQTPVWEWTNSGSFASFAEAELPKLVPSQAGACDGGDMQDVRCRMLDLAHIYTSVCKQV